MIPMFKQKVGMTKIYAKGIAELFLIRCNPYHWDGSGEVPDNISFDVYKRKIDETYDGCTLEIQLCKPDGCLCYAASVHLYEGGFWTGHGIGCFDKTAICNDPGSVDALTSAIMRVCMIYENLTNFRKVFVKCLTISQKRMNEIKQYTDDGKEQDEIEFESVIFADGTSNSLSPTRIAGKVNTRSSWMLFPAAKMCGLSSKGTASSSVFSTLCPA